VLQGRLSSSQIRVSFKTLAMLSGRIFFSLGFDGLPAEDFYNLYYEFVDPSNTSLNVAGKISSYTHGFFFPVGECFLEGRFLQKLGFLSRFCSRFQGRSSCYI